MSYRPEIIKSIEHDDNDVKAEPISHTMFPVPQYRQPSTAAPQNSATGQRPGAAAHHQPDDAAAVTAIEIISITRRSLQRLPPGAARKPVRLRGLLVPTLVTFYRGAEVHVHRLGDNDPTTSLPYGREALWATRELIDRGAMYRVTVSSCRVAAVGEPELVMRWVKEPGAAQGSTADDFVSVLHAGGESVGRLMMWTVQTSRGPGSAWVLARQIPGKNHTFEEYLDILKVPAEMRSQIIEFGPKRWVNGELIPAVWAAKDLSVGQAASKIRNVMRE